MFIVRRFMQDFARWEQEQIEQYTSSITSTHDLATYLTRKPLSSMSDVSGIQRELEMWTDMTVEEMVASFRKRNLDAKHFLLFLKENQNRYFDRSHMVKCSKKHVVGMFPLDDGIDGGTSYCPYCEADVEMPTKLHQQVIYNWKA